MVDLRIPNATYRIQFNGQFGFPSAQPIIPYLHRLGISDLYASPMLKARHGSTHGYDNADPRVLNPELGSAQDFEALSTALQAHGMGLLLDIVPNHMSASPQNPWWLDVLEKGTLSPYASFFDIDWHPVQHAIEGKILLPILGNPYGETLENQELQISLDHDGIYLHYYETRLPLSIQAWAMLISYRLDVAQSPPTMDDANVEHLRGSLQAIAALPSSPRAEQIDALKGALLQAIHDSDAVRAHLMTNMALFNGVKGDPTSFDRLHTLLSQQAYQLAFWQTSTARINYRRFFDISDLVGIRMEDPQVFEATHAFVLNLIQQQHITGLRIDHIDGLYDPLAYLHRLQSHSLSARGITASGEQSFYVVVEKILTGEETLSEDWPVAGTTGYEFLIALNRIFVDSEGFEKLKSAYYQLIASEQTFPEMVYAKKKQVMSDLFAGEVRSLSHALARLAQYDRYALDIPLDQLTALLIDVTACLPVYRTYIDRQGVSASDQHLIEQTISEARRRNPALAPRALNFFERVALLQYPIPCSAPHQHEWLEFVLHWQQLTGPVMAKGVEDTALYNYNCLISLNDVGGEPEVHAASVQAFHAFNQQRVDTWPHTLNATSTHDTKRSEDVRARINVLAEMPEVWHDHLHQWRLWNHDHKRLIDTLPIPDANTELLVYQTLIGAWPLSEGEIPQFHERFKGYVIKAAREAKALTNWLSPQPDYEAALLSFVDAILEPTVTNRFLTDFLPFQEQIAFFGSINALSQVLLKIAAPGIPDFYQGSELWDLSMVDPDNRRPVDFTKHQALLDDLIEGEFNDRHDLLSGLLQSWRDGRVKLYLTYKALHTRHANANVFLQGRYTPLSATGAKQEHVTAFARHHGETWIIVAVPRLSCRLCAPNVFPLGEAVWETGELVLPHDAPGTWSNVFTGESLEARPTSGGLRLSELFFRFPVALLIGKP